MCAIAGSKNHKEVKKMLSLMSHRSPDGEEIISYHDYEFSIGMGRLAIIDRGSNKSLAYTRWGTTVSFNGEIYNYRDIRKQLENIGYEFETECDTEVILVAFKQWGTDCFAMFDGMFAIAIKDGPRVILARDIMGQKPLYYKLSKQYGFAFASEAKALYGPGTSITSHTYFNNFEHVLGEKTLYRNVYQVLPAHFLVFDIVDDSLVEKVKYYTLKHRHIDRRHVLEELDILIGNSLRKMLSEVKDISTLYLSGGVDSTLLNTYHRFSDPIKYDYSEDNKKDFEKNIKKIAHLLDFPVGSFSSYALYNLSKKAHEKGKKVILSGEGADEVFGGYMRYVPVANMSQMKNLYPSYLSLFSKAYEKDFDIYGMSEVYARITKREANLDFYKNLTDPYFEKFEPIEAMQRFDLDFIFPSLLQMGDRMAMANQIENRCPFLDRDVVEFGLSLPPDLKINNSITKVVLRQLLAKRGGVAEREKTGLLVPYNKWYGLDGYSRGHYFNKLNNLWKKQSLHR